jgi:hypothetical protein
MELNSLRDLPSWTRILQGVMAVMVPWFPTYKRAQENCTHGSFNASSPGSTTISALTWPGTEVQDLFCRFQTCQLPATWTTRRKVWSNLIAGSSARAWSLLPLENKWKRVLPLSAAVCYNFLSLQVALWLWVLQKRQKTESIGVTLFVRAVALQNPVTDAGSFWMSQHIGTGSMVPLTPSKNQIIKSSQSMDSIEKCGVPTSKFMSFV